MAHPCQCMANFDDEIGQFPPGKMVTGKSWRLLRNFPSDWLDFKVVKFEWRWRVFEFCRAFFAEGCGIYSNVRYYIKCKIHNVEFNFLDYRLIRVMLIWLLENRVLWPFPTVAKIMLYRLDSNINWKVKIINTFRYSLKHQLV